MDDEASLSLEPIAAYLVSNPPPLWDILAASCELYRADPGELNSNEAREMFLYCARRFAGRSYDNAGALVGMNKHEAHARMRNFCQRLGSDNRILRADLDYMLIRLTECVMRRRRHR